MSIKRINNTNNINIYRIGSNNQYEIFKSNKLGTSNNSNVYLGRCLDSEKAKIIKRSDKLVAIKKIDIYKLSPESKKLVSLEIQMMKDMINKSHINIVSCYDIIQDDTVVYIIMEYCNDGDMSSILVRPINEKYIKYYFKQIINAVKYLYNKNIIHGDLKPNNILLNGNKRTVKLCDFGLVKKINETMIPTLICGSPLYMAPELLSKKSRNQYSSDIWSLGLILYEMIYGYNPLIQCKDIIELTTCVTTKNIDFPKKTSSGNIISESCLSLLKSMLDKDSSKRISFIDLFNNDWLNEIDNEINFSNIDDWNIMNIYQTEILEKESFSSSDCEIFDIEM